MPHAADRWTAERVRALPDDGNRYELIEGELVVTPAPRGVHQEAIMGLVTGARLRDWGDIIDLRLVVEVLSPSTARYDRHLKRRRYQRARIDEYWIVDPDARLIERWRPNDERPEVVAGGLVWAADPDQPSFQMDVSEFFADVLGTERPQTG